jgi:hypothetical protein
MELHLRSFVSTVIIGPTNGRKCGLQVLSDFFLHVSHDSFVSVVTLTRDFYNKAFGLLKELDLNPQPGQEGQVRRFCRAP